MLTRYIHFKVDGTETEGSVDWPEKPGYDLMRPFIESLLDGAEMEHVNVLYNNHHLDMFVDEIGKIKHLPRNDKATAIYRANWLKMHPRAKPESLDIIAGPAVLFLRRIWF